MRTNTLMITPEELELMVSKVIDRYKHVFSVHCKFKTIEHPKEEVITDLVLDDNIQTITTKVEKAYLEEIAPVHKISVYTKSPDTLSLVPAITIPLDYLTFKVSEARKESIIDK